MHEKEWPHFVTCSWLPDWRCNDFRTGGGSGGVGGIKEQIASSVPLELVLVLVSRGVMSAVQKLEMEGSSYPNDRCQSVSHPHSCSPSPSPTHPHVFVPISPFYFLSFFLLLLFPLPSSLFSSSPLPPSFLPSLRTIPHSHSHALSLSLLLNLTLFNCIHSLHTQSQPTLTLTHSHNNVDHVLAQAAHVARLPRFLLPPRLDRTHLYASSSSILTLTATTLLNNNKQQSTNPGSSFYPLLSVSQPHFTGVVYVVAWLIYLRYGKYLPSFPFHTHTPFHYLSTPIHNQHLHQHIPRRHTQVPYPSFCTGTLPFFFCLECEQTSPSILFLCETLFSSELRKKNTPHHTRTLSFLPHFDNTLSYSSFPPPLSLSSLSSL
ncbi:hypothetical protein BKA57DRAFT_108820 [Linnemannia elongata]|nr:hypothetical protein BKA57DRAFT_108820 [Linnemannia elongata]